MPETRSTCPVFYHVPKCAGSAVAKSIEDAFGAANILRCYAEQTIDPIPDEFEFHGKAIMGHYVPWNLTWLPEGVKPLRALIIRHPVPRTCSLYNFGVLRSQQSAVPCMDTTVYDEERVQPIPFAEWLDRSLYASESMTAYLADRLPNRWRCWRQEPYAVSGASLAKAMQIIAEADIVLALDETRGREHSRGQIAAFCAALGVTQPATTDYHVSPKVVDPGNVDHAAILASNMFDMMLYEAASARSVA